MHEWVIAKCIKGYSKSGGRLNSQECGRARCKEENCEKSVRGYNGRILEALKKIEGIPECKLVFYGSTENGFWQGKASDIDCSIVMADPHQRVKTADVVSWI